MKKHACRTYFRIVGEFEPDVILNALALTDNKTVCKCQKRSATEHPSEFDEIKIGFCDTYNIDVNQMLRKTLKDLKDKADVLVSLKHRYELAYYLVIVPELESKSEDPFPILSLDGDIVEFLYLTQTEQDLDYYIYW